MSLPDSFGPCTLWFKIYDNLSLHRTRASSAMKWKTVARDISVSLWSVAAKCHVVYGTLLSQMVQLLYKSFHLTSTFSEQTAHENLTDRKGLFIKFRVEWYFILYVPQYLAVRKIMRNVRTSCHWAEIRSPFIPNITNVC